MEDGEDVFPAGSAEPAPEPVPEEVAMEENPQDILDGCLERFASADFIMEPEIFTQLKTYFQGNKRDIFKRIHVFNIAHVSCFQPVVVLNK